MIFGKEFVVMQASTQSMRLVEKKESVDPHIDTSNA
jgi:hypothetical protein